MCPHAAESAMAMAQHRLRCIRVILIPSCFVSSSTHEEMLMIRRQMMVSGNTGNTKEDQESGGRNNAPARIGTQTDR
jgi:hypothetical protein